MAGRELWQFGSFYCLFEDVLLEFHQVDSLNKKSVKIYFQPVFKTGAKDLFKVVMR